MSRTAVAERCFLSHSPTLRPWIACRRLRELAMTVVLRGGALEPEPLPLPENAQAKADTYSQRAFSCRSAEGLSLSGGASIRTVSSQAGHHPFVRCSGSRPETTKATLPDRPRVEAPVRMVPSAHASLRGRSYCRAGARPRRAGSSTGRPRGRWPSRRRSYGCRMRSSCSGSSCRAGG
jgi:hypothetical protein